jgi:hypothetical protein
MKRIFIISGVALLMCLHYAVFAQTQTRYFQFTTSCGHGNWQDTAYVAGTSDPALIAQVLAELDKPKDERKFIAGKIAAGHGGHNRNASHWFKWHYIPGEWALADAAMEVCDGCPYSDVDADTTYWLRNIGLFCSWGGQPMREVAAPTGIDDRFKDQVGINVYPNPATNTVTLNRTNDIQSTVTICNAVGQNMLRDEVNGRSHTIDISALPAGSYYLKLQSEHTTMVRQLLIQR